MELLSHLLDEALGITRMEYLASYPYPVVVTDKVHSGAFERRELDQTDASFSGSRGSSLRGGREPMTSRRGRAATLLHQRVPGSAKDRGPATLEFEGLPEGQRYSFVRARSVRKDPTPGVLIGRSAECDVVINDYSISQRHGLLVVQPAEGLASYKDLGSTNGSAVDGIKLRAHRLTELHGGAQLRLGRFTLTFLWAEEIWSYMMHSLSAPAS